MLINKELSKKVVATLAVSLFLSGCSDSLNSEAGEDFNGGGVTDPTPSNEFDESALLTGLTEKVLVPAIESFQNSTQPLIDRIGEYCQAIESDVEIQTSLNNAKQSWRETMNGWQQLEVMQMGPVTYNDAILRNSIYSWPVVRHCAVDQDVGHFEAGQVSGKAYDISQRTSDRRGLVALEYLLFNENLSHSCSSDNLAPDGWNDRSAKERQLARCHFAQEVAKDLQNSGNTLFDAWQQDSIGYSQQLTQAGTDNSSFDTAHDAVNKITDAMFYIDSVTKDSKLAAPIGLNPNSCGTATCLEDIESILSDNAVANIKHNMIALQSLFLGAPVGTDGTGFDDYLIAVDAQVLADSMAADIQAAIDAADSFAGSMTDAVSNEPNKVQSLHAAVKAVTDNMKSLFITYLSLELPLTSAGDAD